MIEQREFYPHEEAPLEVFDGYYRVDWEHIGEGYSGDYDPDDPDDVPLLRFSCYRLEDGEWEQMDDASYCTQLPVDTPAWFLREVAYVIHDDIRDTTSYKRNLEYMSWVGPDDLQAAVERTLLTKEDLE